MVSEDLIIGMELNFLKTKREKKKKKKGKEKKREKERKKEGKERRETRRRGKHYQSSPEGTFLPNPLLLCMNPYAGKEKQAHDGNRERARESVDSL